LEKKRTNFHWQAVAEGGLLLQGFQHSQEVQQTAWEKMEAQHGKRTVGERHKIWGGAGGKKECKGWEKKS